MPAEKHTLFAQISSGIALGVVAAQPAVCLSPGLSELMMTTSEFVPAAILLGLIGAQTGAAISFALMASDRDG